MIEVAANLYIGSALDYEGRVRQHPEWAVVQACKDPYHRQALGYRGRDPDPGHAEFDIARRGHRLILNMVDARDPKYLKRAQFEAALGFVASHLGAGSKVLIHCNQGRSRAPAIAMLLLASEGRYAGLGFPDAEREFTKIYPDCEFGAGVRAFLMANWAA